MPPFAYPMRRSVWLEKGRKSYSVRWYDEQGKKQREWCPDFQTAQRRYVEIKQRLLTKAQGLGDAGAPPLEIFERYLTTAVSKKTKRRFSEGTKRIRRYSLLPFLKTVRRLGDLSPQKIRNFRDESLKTHSSTTVNIELRDLRAFLNWCIAEEILKDSPFKAIQIPHSRERGRKLTLDELMAIIRASDPKFRPYLMLIGYTGTRLEETRLAKWEDIDGDMWTIHAENTKTKAGRVVAIHPRVLKELGPRGTGRVFPHLTKYGPDWYMGKALRDSKIEGNATLHDLRHTFASHWKGNPMELMRHMGWKSIEMVKRYFHINADELKQYVRKHGIGAELGHFDVTSPKTNPMQKD